MKHFTRQELIKLWLTEVLAENPEARSNYRNITDLFWQDAKELVERVDK